MNISSWLNIITMFSSLLAIIGAFLGLVVNFKNAHASLDRAAANNASTILLNQNDQSATNA